MRIDGVPLDGQRLEQLHRETAWVDPAVQLWNRSLLDNLSYGAPADPSLPLGQVIAQAHLRSVLERLPDGLQTRLGEGGALVSGGEGQRVRLARAMLRPAATRPAADGVPAAALASAPYVGRGEDEPSLIEARDLVFRYRARGTPVLQGSSLCSMKTTS
jgi:ABC-type cobalamin transport system ATPase subunit